MGEHNIDTRYISPKLRSVIEGMFTRLYNAHFEPLTVAKILEAARYPEAMRMQYAQLRSVEDRLIIVMRYGDKEEHYTIPYRLESYTQIHIEDIPGDIIRS